MIEHGYTVDLAGELVPGTLSDLTVTKGGQPIIDLGPYLGAYGHLVALREGDLAYLHAHPLGEPGGGPEITFVVEVPTAGTYRLFLDFQHGGVVRMADFTVAAAGAGTRAPGVLSGSTPPAESEAHSTEGHSH